MGRDDWYRGPLWDPETQQLFEAKLTRAREASRAQYLRIKGLELTASQDPKTRDAGRGLLTRVVTEYPDDELQVTWAHRDLGESYAADGHADEAADHFEQALAADRPEPSVALSLAELIVHAKWNRRYQEALDLLLSSDAARDPFPATRFRWNLTAARVSALLGKDDDARELAQLALHCLDETQSPFPRHRSLGLTSADRKTRHELERLAGS